MPRRQDGSGVLADEGVVLGAEDQGGDRDVREAVAVVGGERCLCAGGVRTPRRVLPEQVRGVALAQRVVAFGVEWAGQGCGVQPQSQLPVQRAGKEPRRADLGPPDPAGDRVGGETAGNDQAT